MFNSCKTQSQRHKTLKYKIHQEQLKKCLKERYSYRDTSLHKSKRQWLFIGEDIVTVLKIYTQSKGKEKSFKGVKRGAV